VRRSPDPACHDPPVIRSLLHAPTSHCMTILLGDFLKRLYLWSSLYSPPCQGGVPKGGGPSPHDRTTPALRATPPYPRRESIPTHARLSGIAFVRNHLTL